jgi:hypothetical protein
MLHLQDVKNVTHTTTLPHALCWKSFRPVSSNKDEKEIIKGSKALKFVKWVTPKPKQKFFKGFGEQSTRKMYGTNLQSQKSHWRQGRT